MRTLRIGDARFAWTARLFHHDDGTDCYRCVRLRVWGGGKNSRVLSVDLLSTSEPGPWGRCTTDTAYPTPRDVRAVIDHALQHGWDPNDVGAPYVLVAGTGLELAGFRVSDAPLLPRGALSPTPRFT